MNNIFYVYQLRLEGSEKPFYVGKGSGYRSSAHFLPSKLSAKTHKNNTIRKAQEDGVEIFIEKLKEGLSEVEAFEIERSLISDFGRRDLGTGCLTNNSDGGEGQTGRIFSEDLLSRMSASAKARGISQETRDKITAKLVGKRASPETRARMSAAHKGRKTSDAHRLALSKAQTGKSLSPETRAKISATKRAKSEGMVKDE